MLNSVESLEHICKNCDNECCPYIHYDKSRCVFYGLIWQDLDQLEKLEKVIGILKSNLYLEFNDKCNYICLKRDKYDECDYTIIFPSKEDYDLLKEVLEND